MREFVRELRAFAWQYKAYWITPIVLVVLLIAGLVLTNYSVAPFHYTLF